MAEEAARYVAKAAVVKVSVGPADGNTVAAFVRRGQPVPDGVDPEKLEALAARTHTSKHALLLQGAQYVVERAARRGLVDDAVDFVLSHDADLLRRLEDA